MADYDLPSILEEEFLIAEEALAKAFDPDGLGRLASSEGGFCEPGDIGLSAEVVAPVDEALKNATMREWIGEITGRRRYDHVIHGICEVAADHPDVLQMVGDVLKPDKLYTDAFRAAVRRLHVDGEGPVADAVRDALLAQGCEAATADEHAGAIAAVVGEEAWNGIEVGVQIRASNRIGQADSPVVFDLSPALTTDNEPFAEWREEIPATASLPPRVFAFAFSDALDRMMAVAGAAMPNPAALRRIGDFPRKALDAAIRGDAQISSALGIDRAAVDRFKPGYDWSKLVMKALDGASDRVGFWTALDGAVERMEASLRPSSHGHVLE